MKWLYIYYRRDEVTVANGWFYDRSMPAQCLHEASARLRVLSKRYGTAAFTVGSTIPAFY